MAVIFGRLVALMAGAFLLAGCVAVAAGGVAIGAIDEYAEYKNGDPNVDLLEDIRGVGNAQN